MPNAGCLKRFRPSLITVAATCAWLAWSWLSMSTMDYQRGTADWGFRTAGWFILGLPFNVGLGLLFSVPFSMVARRSRQWLAWIILLVISSVALVGTYVAVTPAARLNHAIGIQLSSDAKLQRLHVYDSLNEGETTFGVLSVSSDFLPRLVEHHALVQRNVVPSLMLQLSNEAMPREGSCYCGDRLTVYYDQDTSLLYFVRR